MSKEYYEINKKIGEILGFTSYPIKNNGKETGVLGWNYPEKYKWIQTSIPSDLPDFLQMIQNNNVLHNMWFAPKCYGVVK